MMFQSVGAQTAKTLKCKVLSVKVRKGNALGEVLFSVYHYIQTNCNPNANPNPNLTL